MDDNDLLTMKSKNSTQKYELVIYNLSENKILKKYLWNGSN
jgi:hypothetical protein